MRNPFKNAACTAVASGRDGHNTARNRRIGGRSAWALGGAFVGCGGFNSCLVGLGVGDFGRRAFPEPYTSGAATWSRPEGEAGSPRIRHNSFELAEVSDHQSRSRCCTRVTVQRYLQEPNSPAAHVLSCSCAAGLLFMKRCIFNQPFSSTIVSRGE